MHDTDRSALQRHFEALDGNERNKLMKRAAKLRKTRQKKDGGKRRRDDSEGTRPMRQRGGAPLQELALKLLADDLAAEAAHAEANSDSDFAADGGPRAGAGSAEDATHDADAAFEFVATAVWTGRGRCRVLAGGEHVDCVLSPALAAVQQSELAVGDDVRVRQTPGAEPFALATLPRRTTLSRPDPHVASRERVIAANVDAVGIVVPVGTAPLRTGIIDRFWIAVERGGANAFVVINKIDLLTDAERRASELARLDPYRDLGLDVLICSAATGEGIEALRARIRGRTIALAGHSGVGKSSLLTAVAPELDLNTGDIRHIDGKGRHTTTAASLFELQGGTRVIDTPGIRSLGLWELGADELAAYFPEFRLAAAGCRFGDCSHTHEPNCGVRTAVELGTIAPARFDAYLRVRETL